MKKEIYPLTSYQHGIWEEQIIRGDIPIYIIGGYILIKNKIDESLLVKSIEKLIQRNDALRIKIIEKHLKAYQYVDDIPNYNMQVIDFSNEVYPSESCISWIQAKFNQNMPIYNNELFNFALLKAGDNEYYLYAKFHHIINDGWGISLFVQKTTDIYNKLLANERLNPESTSYLHFVEKDISYKKSNDYINDKAYWQDIYTELPDKLIPVDKKSNSFKSKEEKTTIDFEIYKQIQKELSPLHLSNFHYFLGLLFIYFSKIFNKNEIVIGIPLLNRKNFNDKNTMGLFTNVIPFKMSINSDISFIEFITNIKNELRRLYRYQTISLADINSMIRKTHSDNNIPIDITFSFEFHNYNVSFDKGRQFIKNLNTYHSNIPLAFFIREYQSKEDVALDLYYQDWVFDANYQVENILSQLKYLIFNCYNNPDKQIKDIQIITDEEKNKLLFEFNKTENNYPLEKTIVELFEERVLINPESIALVCENHEISYADLNTKANQLSHLLRKNGITTGNIVGIMVERSIEMIIAMLGILKAGGTYLPLDPQYPTVRIKYMVDNSNVKFVITDEKYDQIDKDIEIINLKESAYETESESNLELKTKADSLAYVIYTSGSTGNPKGVMISHKAVNNFIHGICKNVELNEGDCLLSVTTFSFDIFVLESLLTLVKGVKVVIASKEELANSKLLNKRLLENKVNAIQATPSLMKLFMDSFLSDEAVNSLAKILIGGEAFPEELLQDLQSKTQARIYNMYGPTETTVWSTMAELTNEVKLTIGKPISNTKIYILDADMQITPINVPGELCISGDGLAKGYLFNETLTEEKFVKNPYGEGRLYKTGDLAKWLPDGNIECLGRIDNQIKIRGLRIELGEIESVLIKQPGIKTAVVQVIQHGESQSICGYFESEKDLNTNELKDSLNKVLPKYMVPTYFVRLEKIPLSSNGKIDRKNLPLPELLPEQNKFIAPSDKVETDLCKIFTRTLNIEKVGVNYNFFEIGGDSIKAMQLNHYINEAGYLTNVTDIFNYPIISDLATLIKSSSINSELIKEISIAQTSLSKEYNEECVIHPFISHDEKNLLYVFNKNLETQQDKIHKYIIENFDKSIHPNYIKFIDSNDFTDSNLNTKTNQLSDFLELKNGKLFWIVNKLISQIKASEKRIFSDLLNYKVKNVYQISPIQKYHSKWDVRLSSSSFVLDGLVDINRINNAWNKLIKTQSNLRTYLTSNEDGILANEIEEVKNNEIIYIDVSDFDFEIKEKIIDEIIKKLFKVDFPLFNSINYRVFLIKENLSRHKFIILGDHLYFDFISFEIIKRNLFNTFQNENQPEQPVHYSKFINQINKGPQNITDDEIIEKFYLAEFKNAFENIYEKINAFNKPKVEYYQTYLSLENIQSYSFEQIRDLTFTTFCYFCRKIFNTDLLPLCNVYHGRSYQGQKYFETIGEFVDFVPVLIDLKKSSGSFLSFTEIISMVERYNINFTQLISSGSRIKDYISNLKYKTPTALTFNYLGKVNVSDKDIVKDAVAARMNATEINIAENAQIAFEFEAYYTENNTICINLVNTFGLDMVEMKQILEAQFDLAKQSLNEIILS